MKNLWNKIRLALMWLICRVIGHRGEGKLGDKVNVIHTSRTYKKGKKAWYFCSRCERQTTEFNPQTLRILNMALKKKAFPRWSSPRMKRGFR